MVYAFKRLKISVYTGTDVIYYLEIKCLIKMLEREKIQYSIIDVYYYIYIGTVCVCMYK